MGGLGGKYPLRYFPKTALSEPSEWDSYRSGLSPVGQESLVGFVMAVLPLVVCNGVPSVGDPKIGSAPKAQACSLIECLLLKPGRLDGRSHLDLLAFYALGVGRGLEAMD